MASIKSLRGKLMITTACNGTLAGHLKAPRRRRGPRPPEAPPAPAPVLQPPPQPDRQRRKPVKIGRGQAKGFVDSE